MNTNQMITNLETLVNAVMIAYWGSTAPCEKAWNHACKIIDQFKVGKRKPSHTKVWDALEWLVEATKHDPKIICG